MTPLDATPSTSVKVAVTGASGFVGSALIPALLARGHTVVGLSRSARASTDARLRWAAYDPLDAASVGAAIAGCDAVVNLAGDNLFEGRWSAAKRARIVDSRVGGTAALAKAIEAAEQRPSVLVSASAVGYYGPRPPEEDLDETSAPGTDFLAEVCRDWEKEALAVERLGVRVAVARFGVVLGKRGGPFAKMLTPFRCFVGGPVGSGRQPTSWIHVDDLVAMLVAMLEDDLWHGVYNATAPGVVSNQELAKALGHALHRPSFLRAPAFALRIVFGKVASILTTGQRVLPKAALARGFTFRFPTIEPALADLLGKDDA